jgi:hypothetical protein
MYAEPKAPANIRGEDNGQCGCPKKSKGCDQEWNAVREVARKDAEADHHGEETKGKQRYVT